MSFQNNSRSDHKIRSKKVEFVKFEQNRAKGMVKKREKFNLEKDAENRHNFETIQIGKLFH